MTLANSVPACASLETMSGLILKLALEPRAIAWSRR